MIIGSWGKFNTIKLIHIELVVYRIANTDEKGSSINNEEKIHRDTNHLFTNTDNIMNNLRTFSQISITFI